MNNAVVGLGELLWDIFPNKKILGGAPANFAYHVSQLGYEGYAVSAIGNDLLGEEILSTLSEKGLKHVIETTNYPTGTVKVKLNDNKIPEYEICENVAWDNIPFLEETENLARNTKLVCFGSLAQRNSVSKDTIRKFLQAMPESSSKIFDINLRQHFYNKDVIHDSLILANMMKINDEELKVIAQMFDLEDDDEQKICKWLLCKYELQIVILTRGTNGSYIFSQDETSFLPTPKVEVVDTVGAGDSFTAAFAVSYMNGEKIADAHKLAVDLSAYVCSQQGAMPNYQNQM